MRYNWNGALFSRFDYNFSINSENDPLHNLESSVERIHNYVCDFSKKLKLEENKSCEDGRIKVRRQYRLPKELIGNEVLLMPSFSVRYQQAELYLCSTFSKDLSLNLKLYDIITKDKDIVLSEDVLFIQQEIDILREGVSSSRDFSQKLIKLRQ